MLMTSRAKAALGLLLSLPLSAQELRVACEANSDTLRTLEALPPPRDYSVAFESRIGPLRALAAQNPDDFFIQRYYQDAFRRSTHLADEFDRALALYRKRPGHPLSRYFEARLLMNAEPSRSKKTFEELLAPHPDFVWPHLDFIEWANLPGRRDPKEVESRLRRFIAVCPTAVDAYENARLADDPALIRTAADNLRRALERRNTPLDTVVWGQLWSLESRGGGDATALAQRIRADLKRIEALPFQPRLELAWIYQQASELLNDLGIVSAFEAKVTREAPQSQPSLWLTQQRWSKENPFPPRDAAPEQRKAYETKKEVAQAAWEGRWPKNCTLAQERWSQLSLRRHQEPDVAVTERDLAVVDRIQRCRSESPDASVSFPPLETLLADFYVSAKTRLNEVPRLLDLGLQASARQDKYQISRDLFPAEMLRRAGPDNAAFAQERTQLVRAGYLIAADRTADARGLARQQIESLDSRQKSAGLPEPEKQRLQRRRAEWVLLSAEIAVKEGHPQEALDLYRSSLEGLNRETLARPDIPLLATVKKLYLANGGADEKWVEWALSGKTAKPAAGRAPLVFSQALPDFSAVDLSGRTWRLLDLNGKATLINYWATWCGPCRGEHPDIQKLHDRLKDRKDAQVITISVDDTPALAAAYVKEKGYTFPVIHAPALADRLFPYAGLPTNFLVNGRGERTSLYGFWGGEEGLTRVLAELAEAARAHP